MNAHHHAASLVAHLGLHHPLAHRSVEPTLLGTAGALGALDRWLDGRAVLLVNADAVHDVALAAALDGWDGERIRFLAAGPAQGLDRSLRLCATLLPPAARRGLVAEPSSIMSLVWRPWAEAGRTEVVDGGAGAFFDCGTPAGYLAANLWISGGRSVVGAGAVVEGDVVDTVVWDGAVVRPHERLVRAVRTTAGRTVLVR